MKTAIRLCDHVPALIRGFLDGGDGSCDSLTV